jgi:hypothetical protein
LRHSSSPGKETPNAWAVCDHYTNEFNRFHPWFQRWLGLLEPESNEVQRKLEGVERIIDAVLPDDETVQEACRGDGRWNR